MILISIIIPVFDDVAGLATTLRSLEPVLLNRRDCEVLVCNDGGSAEISRQTQEHHHREVVLDKNQGSYAARNAGISAARGEVLVFLDADEAVDATWLTAGVSALDDADYVGGPIRIQLAPRNNAWHEYDRLTAFPVSRYLSKMRFAPTANLFVKREVFSQVGLFNPLLRSGGDREFGERVHKAGFRQAYCPDALTYHPARDRDAQFAKRWRTGRGMAEVRMLVWRQSRWFVAGLGCYRLALLPREVLLNTKRMGSDYPSTLRFAWMDSLLGATFHFAFLRRAFVGPYGALTHPQEQIAPPEDDSDTLS